MFQILLQGIGVGIALAAPIGPINIEIIRRGIRGQFLSGWITGFGAVCADSLICILVVAGALRLVDNPWIRTSMFFAGAVVLLLLGVRGIQSALRDDQIASTAPDRGNSFITGFTMAALNPMGIVYWLSIGSALIAATIEQNGSTAGPILVSGVFAGIIMWVTVLSTLVAIGRSRAATWAPRVIGAIGSLLLLIFAIYFAWRGIASLVGSGIIR